ncbi:non-lysosomal glucosylceramidase-like isoform X2 [Pollicipes pollicipes]|uniref:non-lysosomal glucosylceramidase-like isoform X1 n=1 Tax=Pollicipes pollicipes TaxID=41117 RepID=UPI0018858954|nr:non-lysosomal glucosylceramidase-like isoform X1 [Pollicipes pollicipes]XP_037079980.1 non-lysosomal glucosylceramidase-like isoform X2 [Pollicipes pollicipes]
MVEYGFQVKLNHKFPESWDANIRPRLHQVWGFLVLGLRYLVWYVGMWFHGKKPFIDQLHPVTGKQIYGVPLGGIGSGTMGRGFRGEFTRFQMRPGLYDYGTADADQFIVSVAGRAGGRARYQQVLSACDAPADRLSAWRWAFPGDLASYRGLYPRSWTVFTLPGEDLQLTVRQVSPVIPHNYKDTSLPCSVFVWDIENTGDEQKDVSVTFTFENGTGCKNSSAECSVAPFGSEQHSAGGVCGMAIDQEIAGVPCRYALAARLKDDVAVSRGSFDPTGNGLDLWNELAQTGSLTLQTDKAHGPDVGVAVSARVTVPAGERRSLEMSLVWHMPEVHFLGGERRVSRYYTKWFETGRQGADQLSRYALDCFSSWESDIEAWQRPVLTDPDLPDWYKSAIFNELYYISDGGSLWIRMPGEDQLPETDPRREYGRFGYLESHEYIMYNTYDVHFYSSAALVQLWPQLQLSLQYDMAEFVAQEDPETRTMLYSGQTAPRKRANTVPHDVGNPGMPGEMPFCNINSYQIHDVSAWKDLNLKFVLQVYRDLRVTGDRRYLRHMWPTCCAVMNVARAWDTDGDGMIENSGMPDQTYDTWVMEGVSAYCGGLWIAALYTMREMAREQALAEQVDLYDAMLTKAQKVYIDKLWTGSYYRFDSSASGHAQCIMADQLCGHWYLRSSDVTEPVFSHVETALRTVYEHNVLLFRDGRQGAVNGMMPDGQVNEHTMQSEETWTGVTYALAAAMLHEGMVEEGFRTAEGIYRTVYERIGQGFETPEALYPEKHYRAVGYMRPLSIWAMQHAWEQRRRAAGDAV